MSLSQHVTNWGWRFPPSTFLRLLGTHTPAIPPQRRWAETTLTGLTTWLSPMLGSRSWGLRAGMGCDIKDLNIPCQPAKLPSLPACQPAHLRN